MQPVELYRKLPDLGSAASGDGMSTDPFQIEDLLTSDAFGPLRWLPRALFLNRLIRRFRRISDGAAVPNDSFHRWTPALPALEVALWPGYSAPNDFPDGFASAFYRDLGSWTEIRSVEPDVVIGPTCGNPDGAKRLPIIFIECKYTGSVLGDDCSQLARQFWVGRKREEDLKGFGEQADFILVCITRDRRPPLVRRPVLSDDELGITGSRRRCVTVPQQVDEYLRLIGRHFRPDLAPACDAWGNEAASRVYHASWREVAEAFDEGLAELRTLEPSANVSPDRLSDTVSGSRILAEETSWLLMERRGLRGFRGFDGIHTDDLRQAVRQGKYVFLDTDSLRHVSDQDAKDAVS